MRILIVEDELKLGLLLAERLEEEGYFVKTVSRAEDALQELVNGYEMLITDLKLPGISGLELMKRAREDNPELFVILMTAYASVETAVEAMKCGAEDYIVKPFSLDEMALLVKRIGSTRKLKEEIKYHRQKKSIETQIIGDSPAIKKVMELIEKVAPTESNVLILGESGTGKELVARAIHDLSPRANGPFIAINCATLSESLLESELFGHEKGAFTGAHKSKPGRFELADSGTLFLDEIGDLPANIQAKLLRALQERTINRVGGINPIKVNIRLICATNKDIEKAMESGRFRDDLYFRIAVFPIKIPPLDERKEDIPKLAKYFLKTHKYNSSISQKAIDRLVSTSWRGNVRELFNVLERATILAGGNEIDIEHLPQKDEISQKNKNSELKTLEEIEKNALLEALRKTRGNKTETAKLLGITRRMVYSRMNKHHIVESDFSGNF